MKIIIILYKCDFLKLFFLEHTKKRKFQGQDLLQGFCAATEDFSSWNSLKGNFIEMPAKVIGVDFLIWI